MTVEALAITTIESAVFCGCPPSKSICSPPVPFCVLVTTWKSTVARRPEPSASGATLYRVRVGAFPDRATAVSTLKELEAKGYKPFIARGGP